MMKKKLIVFGLACVAACVVRAQDVIVKTTGDSIVTKVETISDDNITYRRWDNLLGPIYTISVQNVARIRYANGTEEVFTRISQSSSSRVASQAISQSLPQANANVQRVPQEKSNVTYNVSVNKNNPATRSDYQKVLTRSGNTYFYDGKAMDKKAYIRFLETNCPAAWQKANTGYKTATAGWCLLGIGAALEMSGIVGVVTTAIYTDSYATANTMLGLTAMYYIGGVSVLASIPTICVGYAKMHNSVDVYNVSCTASEARPYLSVQAGQNGIGLALNF